MSETWSWLIKNISALLRALTLFSPFIFLDLISYSLLLLIGMWVAHIWTNMICIIFILFFLIIGKNIYITYQFYYYMLTPKEKNLIKKSLLLKKFLCLLCLFFVTDTLRIIWQHLELKIIRHMWEASLSDVGLNKSVRHEPKRTIFANWGPRRETLPH